MLGHTHTQPNVIQKIMTL